MTATLPPHGVELVSPRKLAERHNARGLELFAAGRAVAAIAEYDAALTQRPAYADALCNRGAARMAAGDVPGAFADYDRAIALNPRHAESFNNRGIARVLTGDLSAAMADFETAIGLNPRYAAAFDNCAAVHNRQWEHAKAVASYSRAIELYAADPRHRGRVCTLYALRSFSLYHLHQRDAALADLRTAYRLDPDRCSFTVAQTVELGVKDSYEFTLSNCEQYLSTDPDDIISLIRRGLSNLAAGRVAEHAADHARVLKCRVPAEDLAMGLAFLKTLRDRLAAATPNIPGVRDARAQRP